MLTEDAAYGNLPCIIEQNRRVTFTATESGTYYARVSSDRDEVGSYTLSVTDVTPQ